jgi:putative serine protease PepD
MSYCIDCGSLVDDCSCRRSERSVALDPQAGDLTPGAGVGRVGRLRDVIIFLLAGSLVVTASMVVQTRSELGWLAVELAELRELQTRLVDERFATLSATDREASEVLESLQDRLGTLGAEIDEAVLAATASDTPEAREVASQLASALFTVVTDAGQGSAFAVDYRDGRTILVTAFHVVERSWDRSQRTVRLVSGDLTYTANIDAVSASDDLALLSAPHRLPTLDGAAEAVAVGDNIFVGGSPLGLEATISAGIVSAIRTDALQITAPISPGSSGGPVVNADGNVVGVAVSKYVGGGAEGLGFAVPWGVVCDTVLDC